MKWTSSFAAAFVDVAPRDQVQPPTWRRARVYGFGAFGRGLDVGSVGIDVKTELAKKQKGDTSNK